MSRLASSHSALPFTCKPPPTTSVLECNTLQSCALAIPIVSISSIIPIEPQYITVVSKDPGRPLGICGMENQMEKKMENDMETGEYIGVILGLYGNNGKENGKYYSILKPPSWSLKTCSS